MNVKKRVLIINPTSYGKDGALVKSPKAYAPMRTPYYLAALTPERFDIRVVDELVEDLDFSEEVDLVALTGMLHNIPRMYDIAEEFRRRGKPTVAGGVAVYALRQEILSKNPFTSVAIGEGENLWEGILEDFERGALQPVYESPGPVSLDGMRLARWDLLKREKYMKSFVDRKNPLFTVETSRGCPHACSFCLVSRYFGRKVRYRPVSEVVEEVRNLGGKFIVFCDDNILVNTSRAEELFQALKPLGIKWISSFDCTAVKHPEVLRQAAKSGCVGAFIGMESLLPENFESVNKRQNARTDFQDVVQSFREAGIVPILHMIFGMEHDTPETIQWTFDRLIENKVEVVIPWILTPLPGTPLHEQVEEAQKLLHKDYSLYDACHCVLRPASMTPEQLEESYWDGIKRFYSRPNIFKRLLFRRDLLRTLHVVVPALLSNFYMAGLVRRGLHPSTNLT
jgi:radical SAM superfamily enzyme YgiQ (UPF0313 family)